VTTLQARVREHLGRLYPAHDLSALAERVLTATGIAVTDWDAPLPDAPKRYTAAEAVLITYGDSLLADDAKPLDVLVDFVHAHLDGAIETVHVLPFYPSSSDGGFAVVDYREVDPALGDWADLEPLADRGGLMADLILNHGSAQSAWFAAFVADEPPYRDYYRTASPDADLAMVTRPRTHALLHPVQTAAGERHAWCTFSYDQVDFDFENPDVLVEFCGIVDHYLRRGVTRLRLDAVAYVWKREGTTSIHLPETHELVKLLHTLLAARSPRALLITETNVPHDQNVSYFGRSDEAHVVYNFSLVPLVLHTMLAGDSAALTQWAQGLDKLPAGSTYLNFLASHDGLGLRPAEGLLAPHEIDAVVDAGLAVGGQFSSYSDGAIERPYELNASLADLLAGASLERADRFVAAHAIMFAIAGIPAIYIHSLLATPGDTAAVARTNSKRDINRPRLQRDAVEADLAQTGSNRRRIFDELLHLLKVRRANEAFDPDASQEFLAIDARVFVVRRVSNDGQTVTAVTNVTDAAVSIDGAAIGLTAGIGWVDLLTGTALVAEVKLGPWQTLWLVEAE